MSEEDRPPIVAPWLPWPVAGERAFGALADAIGLKPMRDVAQSLQQLALAQVDEFGTHGAFAQLAATAWLESLWRLPLRMLGNQGKAIASPIALLRLFATELDATLHQAMLSERGLAATAAAVRATSRRRFEAQRVADLKREALGEPSRREIDDAHREIQALKRELRRLRQRLDAGESAT